MCMSPGRRPLGWKNTEGVGESRGYESSSGVVLRRGAEVLRRLFFTGPENGD